jgi:hypothetical protein
MRVVFMGTPELASDILRSLDERFEVVAAFCQPDKPVGRKQILTPPPVKETAEELGIPVYQPKGFKNGKAAQLLREMAPDIIAVCAYGRILPQEVLDIPVYGCVNLHGSLLPEYRGSAPVQRAIMDGRYELVCSYILEYENTKNTDTVKRSLIKAFQDKYSAYYVPIERKTVLESKITEIMEYGIKYKDAVHVACAIYAKCDYFLTTDIKFQKHYKGNEISIINPIDFIQITGEEE